MKRLYAVLSGVILATLLGATGCTSSGYGYSTVGVSATYNYPARARLVYAGDGLWVVANQPRPIFFSDGYYWMYTDRGWYMSPRFGAGWRFTYNVPVAIYRIDRPRAYVNFSFRPGMRHYIVYRDRPAPFRVYRDQRTWRDYRYRYQGNRRVYRDYDRRYRGNYR